MAMTQMQLIQSLGEAMAWFERELQWEVEPTELRHLCGRIGELYAALITNGQLASRVNQHGYDVVSAQGERISVKTTAMQGVTGHVSFNPRTFEHVDRVIVLRVNTDAMQVEVLLDRPRQEAIGLMAPERNGTRDISLRQMIRREVPRNEIAMVDQVNHGGVIIRELENGTIEVERDGMLVVPVIQTLRVIAQDLGIPIVNSRGNAFNTRQLGNLVIRTIDQLDGMPQGPAVA